MTAQAGTDRRSAMNGDIMTGMMLMFVAMMIAPLLDIFSKLATAHIPSTGIALVRFLLQSLFMLPAVLWRGSLTEISWRQTGFHAVRGGMLALSMVCYVTALKYMEVADAVAIFFVEPMMLTILSSIFLGEIIGWRRYTACAVGFGGAMLIIQPSFGEVGAVALLPVVTAFCVAVFAIMTRLRAHREDPWAMQLQTGVWGAFFCTIALFALGDAGGMHLTSMAANTALLWQLLAIGIAATLTGILSTYAYRSAPASTLAPMQYFEIVSATILAWHVFGDLPDAVKWLGIAIIMGSGLYILWRERQAASSPVSKSGEFTPPP